MRILYIYLFLHKETLLQGCRKHLGKLFPFVGMRAGKDRKGQMDTGWRNALLHMQFKVFLTKGIVTRFFYLSESD